MQANKQENERLVRAMYQLGDNMEFEAWWANWSPEPAKYEYERIIAKRVWDAAIEAAAQCVEARGAMIGGAVNPTRTAKKIRELIS